MGKKLNERQKIAVSHAEGPMLVLAGPGSGKTTVILCRIQQLLKHKKANPQEILVVTFTKAAAMQMKQRFSERDSGVVFGTFHSIFFRILRQSFGYRVEQVLQEEERRKVLLAFVRSRKWEITDEEEYVSKCIAQMSLMHAELETSQTFEVQEVPKEEFREVCQAYEWYKAENKKIDFEDMMVQCYQLLVQNEEVLQYWQKKFRYIMVDEFQDINFVQYECLRLLAGESRNLFVVGDDDQSIYGFRGARPEFIMQFFEYYPEAKRVTLNINYRSLDEIIALSESVIQENRYRFEKNLEGEQGGGARIDLYKEKDSTEEAEHIAREISQCMEEDVLPEEMAIIYRTNIQSALFARSLYQKGIPYVLKDGGGNIYEHWVTRDLLAYLDLAENPSCDSALLRIINKPKRYISKELLADAEKMPYDLFRSLFVCPSLQRWQEKHLADLQSDLMQVHKRKPYEALRYVRRVIGYDEYLLDYAAYRHSNAEALLQIANEITDLAKEVQTVAELEELLKVLSEQMREHAKDKDSTKKGVLLTTMHGAKGLEFHAVFMPSLIKDILPYKKATTPEEIEEERRLFYVGITRAKERLFLSYVASRYGNEAEPSMFLKKMLGEEETRKTKE